MKRRRGVEQREASELGRPFSQFGPSGGISKQAEDAAIL